jgi:hypothetical protein
MRRLMFIQSDYEAPNQRVETNRRPAFPFEAERQFGPAVCAPRVSSAAVAHPLRWVCM